MGRLRLYPALTGTPNDFHLHSGRGRMIIKQRRFLACAGAIALALLTGTDAPAQLYLGRPIKLVLAEAAGSSNDLVARLLAPPIAALLGQPVVVENRPGGGTLIGTRSVIDAAADGHTLLVSSTSALTVASLLNVSDLLKELSPVAGIARTSWVLVVNPAIPAKSLAELVAYARANPGKLNIGFAQGTGPQFVAEAFKAVAGIDVVGIPYAGGSQVVRDLLGGSVQLYFGSAATTLPLIEAGSLRALVSTGESRDPLLPDVPTMKELGVPAHDAEFRTWYLRTGTNATGRRREVLSRRPRQHALRAGIGQHRQDRLCARGPVATGVWTSAAGVSADLGSDGPRDRLRSEVSSGSAAAFDKPSKDKTGASRAINLGGRPETTRASVAPLRQRQSVSIRCGAPRVSVYCSKRTNEAFLHR